MWMWLLSHDFCTEILLLLKTWQCHRHRFTGKCWGSVLLWFQVVLSDIWLDLFGKSSKRGASRPAGAVEATVCVTGPCCRGLWWGDLHCLLLVAWCCSLLSQCLNWKYQRRSCKPWRCFQTQCRHLGGRDCGLVPIRSNAVEQSTKKTCQKFITSVPVWISAPQHQGCTTQV